MLHVKSSGSVKIISVDYDLLIRTLKESCRRIRKNVPGVVEILLFGSFAKGDYTPESDLDILIIVKQTDVAFLERRDLFLDFFRSIPFDLNILVYTEDEIRKMNKENNAFIRDITAQAEEL